MDSWITSEKTEVQGSNTSFATKCVVFILLYNEYLKNPIYNLYSYMLWLK